MPGYATTPGNTVQVGTQNFNGTMLSRPFAPRPTSTVILPSRPVAAVPQGWLRVWNGTVWLDKQPQAWNGTAWVPKPVKVWNGTAWVAV